MQRQWSYIQRRQQQWYHHLLLRNRCTNPNSSYSKTNLSVRYYFVSSITTTTTTNIGGLLNSNVGQILSSSIQQQKLSFSSSSNDTNKINPRSLLEELQSTLNETINIKNDDTTVTSSTITETSSTSSSSFYNAEQKRVMEQCYSIHSDIIMKFNTKWNGPLENEYQSPYGTTAGALPLVLLLGNHSSGKSTFCNYLLGRRIQTAGVAPTDDSFTIIAPGPVDSDQDGIALAGNPDLGFRPLRQFGPTLLHHTLFKVRADTRTNFLLVDTPGMIDAPGNYNGMLASSSSSSTTKSMDRGYDFTGVVRWLANRADIVCLFFDPDKPGTTGETLSVLLHALSGMDHKLLIVLNKADQFTKIHDFARAYGSLCWNLSKVIPRKDLPKIYTMCLPTGNTTNTTTTTTSSLASGLQDLHTARDEVVAEVFKAPTRRIDNVITDLQYSTHQLYMHGIMLQDIKTRWSQFVWNLRKQFAITTVTCTSLTVGLLSLVNSKATLMIPTSGLEYIAASTFAGTILVAGGLQWYQNIQLQEYRTKIVHDPDEIQQAFIRTHRKAVRDGDEYEISIWNKIKFHFIQSISEYPNAQSVPTISTQELQQLRTILEKDIPNLRRIITPEHYKNN